MRFEYFFIFFFNFLFFLGEATLLLHILLDRDKRSIKDYVISVFDEETSKKEVKKKKAAKETVRGEVQVEKFNVGKLTCDWDYTEFVNNVILEDESVEVNIKDDMWLCGTVMTVNPDKTYTVKIDNTDEVLLNVDPDRLKRFDYTAEVFEGQELASEFTDRGESFDSATGDQVMYVLVFLIISI